MSIEVIGHRGSQKKNRQKERPEEFTDTFRSFGVTREREFFYIEFSCKRYERFRVRKSGLANIAKELLTALPDREWGELNSFIASENTRRTLRLLDELATQREKVKVLTNQCSDLRIDCNVLAREREQLERELLEVDDTSGE